MCTFELHRQLAGFLTEMPWHVEGVVPGPDGQGRIEAQQEGTMFQFYENYLRLFGDCLTDMERNGIKVT